MGFGLGCTHQDAFSRGKTIGFDHNRRLDFFEITAGFVRVVKNAIGGRWNALLPHEFFAKGFTAFELGGRPIRAEHAQALRLKQIDDPET